MANPRDEVIDAIAERVCVCLKGKAGDSKFLRSFHDDEVTRQTILDWIDLADHRLLVFSGLGGDKFSVSYAVPQKQRKKGLYFLKPAFMTGVTTKALNTQVICGELSAQSLNELSLLSHEVVYELLRDPANRADWSGPTAQEVLSDMNSYLASLYVTVGQTQGRTLLPMPPPAAFDVTVEEKERVHLLEDAIVQWSNQIQHVLKTGPDSQLESGEHPGPMAEIEFWDQKAEDLNAIQEQLTSDEHQRVVTALNEHKSVFGVQFDRVLSDVREACEEANDNVRFLKAVRPHFERLRDELDFDNIPKLFLPMFHTLLLIFQYSLAYNTRLRLTVVLQKCCNELINQAQNNVSGETVFRFIDEENVSEVVRILDGTIAVCESFKDTFEQTRERASQVLNDQSWEVPRDVVFARLDAFVERCEDIREFSCVVQDFSKLEKIHVGGTKGQSLTDSVHQVFSDFTTTVERFKALGYDIMDITVPSFDDDIYRFRMRVKAFERRLAAVLTTAFDDSASLNARFQMLESFEGLLDRPIIKDELDSRRAELLAAYRDELLAVQAIFHEYRAAPRIDRNMPPIAGALAWCRALRDRVEEPLPLLRQYTDSIRDSPLRREVEKLYATASQQLRGYENAKIEEWKVEIDESSTKKLNKPLLRRDNETRRLAVNFDDALVRLLREVKYFFLLNLDVPRAARAVFERREEYRQRTGNLDLIVHMYNEMEKTLNEVERPLVQQDIESIDVALVRGIVELNWNSESTAEFISSAMELTTTVYDKVKMMHDNKRKITEMMAKFAEDPMVERKTKPLSPSDFGENLARIAEQRQQALQKHQKAFLSLVYETREALGADDSTPEWHAYVAYLENAVQDGLAKAVIRSIDFLSEQLDPERMQSSSVGPMLEVKLGLYANDVLYNASDSDAGNAMVTNPSGSDAKADGEDEDAAVDSAETVKDVWQIVRDWATGFLDVGLVMKRLDGSDFRANLRKNEDILRAQARLHQLLDRNYKKCEEYRASYLEFSELWTKDRQAEFDEFLERARERMRADREREREAHNRDDQAFGGLMAAAAAAAAGDDDGDDGDDAELEDAIMEVTLPLDDFEEQIMAYKSKQQRVAARKTPVEMDWLKINVQPLKQALATWINRWVQTYTSYLYNHVTGKLNDLESMMHDVNQGLKSEVPKGDSDKLKTVLGYIHDVKSSEKRTMAMFAPLRETVNVLKRHGRQLDEYELKLLTDAPMKWDSTVNRVYKVKEQVNHLQNEEVDKIKQQVESFEAELQAFKVNFREAAPFSYDMTVDQAYELIYQQHLLINEIEARAAKLNDLERVFELTVSTHRQAASCRLENGLLKRVWDVVAVVRNQFDAWKGTLWDQIDTDALGNATKKLSRFISGMPTDVKSWDVYTGLLEEVKNLQIVLPLVTQLRSPAMGERHWKELMTATGKHFVMGGDFCLRNLIELELHNYVTDVEEIVQLAEKESKIAVQLSKIEEVWASMMLEFSRYKQTDIMLIKASEELTVALEEHMASLQSMQGLGKFVEFFIDQVTKWQQHLGIVETVLYDWLDVQARWSSLETIFRGSKDIRIQLPEDSERFDEIHTSWVQLQKDAQEEANVVKACSVKGRSELLETMKAGLEQCEKSLNQYLETKRMSFPRFYFLSNAALLDILSNGYNPLSVQKHLGDCFDNIAKLKFEGEEALKERQKIAAEARAAAVAAGEAVASAEETTAEEDILRTGLGMYSKSGGEYVDFVDKFMCDGPVEDWLVRLVDMMRKTLMDILDKARTTAEHWEIDKPRRQWLFDYPAQIALTASQLMWTEEVEQAFEAFEDGQDQAMREYSKVVLERLNALIKLVQDKLTKRDRTKIITLITVDVHNRDVVQRLIDDRVTEASAFAWQSQMRYVWDTDANTAVVKVADAPFRYSYEYVGNTGRLVITPLTDRCYITLTQALRLIMGGAPAGPAGTGKTETTKDLGRAMGLPVYVFNCFPEEDHEILTNRGFLGLEQMEAEYAKGGLEVAGFDTHSRAIVYEEPEAILVNEARSQKLVEFTQAGYAASWGPDSDEFGRADGAERSQQLSVVATGGHDMFVQLGTESDAQITWDAALEPRKVKASELAALPRDRVVRMKSNAPNGVLTDAIDASHFVEPLGLNSESEVDAFLSLFGFWLSHGTVESREGGAECIRFAHNVQLVAVQLGALGMRRGVDFETSGDKSLDIINAEWVCWFTSGELKGDKRLPSWAFQLPINQAQLLLRGVCGDQRQNRICTSSAAFRDQLVQLVLHCGYSPYFELADTDLTWSVTWTESVDPVARTSQGDIRQVPHKGRTWCVRVPSRMLWVRRAQKNDAGVVSKASRPVLAGNCSEQMNVQSMGAVFKGLCQTGAWGCFDEFNRIPIEVLSVVSTQFASILNALREKRDEFDFMGELVKLVDTVGAFITMNPGYAGRTELPENLKALFRSCAMVVPDIQLICENMLMSEGFITAQRLSKKFTTLYSLSKELLSKQMHYDWGLRATKAVLRVAGGLKRAEPNVEEGRILMRALRDFNLPKLVDDDKPIFVQLVKDLFPAEADTKRKVSEEIRSEVAKAAKQRHLQADDTFVLKATELAELLDIRHSVFVIGVAGTGKSEIWRTLFRAFDNMGRKTVTEVLNPKSVRNNELYGWLTKTDWHDGILSTMMRNMSRNLGGYNDSQDLKVIVLDGDIDPEWIESLNTVMDDNKVLTLVSNERIPLTAPMRLLFEISNLDNATPATVSRAGILYINKKDVGSKPFLDTWIDQRNDDHEKSSLLALVNKYITPETVHEMIREHGRIIPVSEMSMIKTLCYLLEGLLANLAERRSKQRGGQADAAAEREVFEANFVFATIWAFGGALVVDKQSSQVDKFDAFWRNRFTAIKFPKEGTVFDYFPDERGQMVPWQGQVPDYEAPEDAYLVTKVFVPTVETVRLRFIVDLLAMRQRPVMLVGTAGTGKTVLLTEYLRSLDDPYTFASINLNAYTDAKSLQAIMESYIDKRSGRTYGPEGNKKLIYFIDDINMPRVDTYGTQSPSALIRQQLDYKCWYDTTKLDRKIIQDVQYLACMNPTSGSFTINSRLQGQFATFGCQLPTMQNLKVIYGQVMANHLQAFAPAVANMCDVVTEATIKLHEVVSNVFLPSSTKFHYQFNLRDLSCIFQGLCMSTPKTFTPARLLKLWRHEATRVLSDRLITPRDVERFVGNLEKVEKAYFKDVQPDPTPAGVDEDDEPPLLFTTFAGKGDDSGNYAPVESFSGLKKTLQRQLEEYNETNAVMNLELFGMAMEHVCRITRIIENPRGSALLVGVGGSGKQSLARLASSICGYTTFQISVTQSYGLNDFKTDLQELYRKCGVKGNQVTFLLTDAQIVDDEWLVYVNDLLSSGYIPDLFTSEDKDGIFAALRSEAKAAGVPDTRGAMQDFFIERVRANLHVVLCFSPVGEVFRVRCRKFPALINCTSIDWFHPWPREALVSVANRFLTDVPDLSESLRASIAEHMAHVHLSVNAASERFKEVERRYNYTTPKSFLELIAFYKVLLDKKRAHLQQQIERLEKGISTLMKTERDVGELKADLESTLVRVEEKREAADVLIKEMGVERSKVEKAQEIAEVEKAKAQTVSAEANRVKEECDTELQRAKPAMIAARNAVDCLSKKSLTNLKSFNNPTKEVLEVTKAVQILKDHEKRNFSWKAAKSMMKDVGSFINQLRDLDKENIPDDIISRLRPILAQDFFSFEGMKSKSEAAANLCNYVVNVVEYNTIYREVAPKMAALEDATAKSEKATAKLESEEAKVAAMEAKLRGLNEKLTAAVDQKNEVEAEAERCNQRLALAERLVNGLADENQRWGASVEDLHTREETLKGNVLLAAAFVSYIGAFNQMFRQQLWQDVWLPDLKDRQIPLTEGVTPLAVLANDSDFARWKNQGLPADPISLENGAIITQCTRWPLLIDPQLQGIKWIKSRTPDLVVVQIGQKRWLSTIVNAVQNGQSVLIESIGEHLEATLDPILSRSVIKRGRSSFIKVGSEEVPYDDNFSLVLQTKLSNPHYKPEIAAQCTLINFIVTEDGLEEQLLALVVNREKRELEEERQALVRTINEYMVTLTDLENELLMNLSNAPEDILSDVALIEGLEKTKETAIETEEKVKQAREQEDAINKIREEFRGVAAEGSYLYFLLIQLNAIDHMYQYSLDAFVTFFFKAMDRATASDVTAERVAALRESIRITVFQWVNRGLFEKHKLIFSSQLCFKLMQKGVLKEEFNPVWYDFFIRAPQRLTEENKTTFLPDTTWYTLQALSQLDGFKTLSSDLVGAQHRFEDWYNKQRPESEALPAEWRKLDDKAPFKKLMIVRTLRNDRMTTALTEYVAKSVPNGRQFTECDSGKSFLDVLNLSFNDSNPNTPIFFILSPGADPVNSVETIAKKRGMYDSKFHRVALGQGQDVVAMNRLEIAYEQGHWVVLENIHLMPRWLPHLENKLDEYAIGSPHEDFRIFLSAEPSNQIPIGLLERSIKLTNEPPRGLKANLKRAFAEYDKEEFEFKDNNIKSILFGLAHFHSIIVERIKFGAQGWNRAYPFNTGDLMNSATVLSNYVSEAGGKIPWSDLRYIFGEILYGGHITDDWDRLLCISYLNYYMCDDLFEEMELFPFSAAYPDDSFLAPPAMDYDDYFRYIDNELGVDTPVAFGLHPNAEIGVKTQQAEDLFSKIVELQPRGAGASGDNEDAPEDASPHARVESQLDSIQEKVKTIDFNLEDIAASIVDDRGPYQNVFLQECERMNILCSEIVRSLHELHLGLEGELQMSANMEALFDAIFIDRVPASWEKLAYPSLRALGSWVDNLVQRAAQLQTWVENPTEIPLVIDISYFFNPQSLLTAIKQVTCQKLQLELDALEVMTDVTRKTREDIDTPPREGAYLTGLFMEGARWDLQTGMIAESIPREMFCPMPVINAKAIIGSKMETSGVFACPMYVTARRGPTFIATATLRSKEPSAKWTLAGVVLLTEAL